MFILELTTSLVLDEPEIDSGNVMLAGASPVIKAELKYEFALRKGTIVLGWQPSFHDFDLETVESWDKAIERFHDEFLNFTILIRKNREKRT